MKKYLAVLMILLAGFFTTSNIKANTVNNINHTNNQVIAYYDDDYDDYDDYDDETCDEDDYDCDSSVPKVAKVYLVISTIWLIICLAAMLFIKSKKEKIIEPVEVYAPDGKDPIEIGYYADGNVDDKDIIAMFFYFHKKGYLKIEKDENNDIKFIKVKDIKDDETEYAKMIFNTMYSGQSEVFNPKDTRIQFAQNYKRLKLAIIQEIEKTKPLYSKLSRTLKSIGMIGVLIQLFVIAITFNFYDDSGLLLLLTGFAGIFYTSKQLIEYRHATNKSERRKYLFFYLFATLCEGIIFEILFNPKHVNAGAGLLISLVMAVTVLISMGIQQLNPEYYSIIGRSRGFKKFLQSVEMDKFNTLIDENPNYYIDILPYIYAFGLSNKFIEEFNILNTLDPEWMMCVDEKGEFSLGLVLRKLIHDMMNEIFQVDRIQKN